MNEGDSRFIGLISSFKRAYPNAKDIMMGIGRLPDSEDFGIFVYAEKKVVLPEEFDGFKVIVEITGKIRPA